jgi:hypothetical protein
MSKVTNTNPPEEHRFKPGQSGNPNGRPLGVPNTKTRLQRLLVLEQEITNPVTGNKEMFTVAEQMDLAMINKARKGDTRAYQALVDRLEGKAPQFIEQKTDLTTQGESINTPTSDIVNRFLESVKDDIDNQAKSNS